MRCSNEDRQVGGCLTRGFRDVLELGRRTGQGHYGLRAASFR
jgi:hypothetical protein